MTFFATTTDLEDAVAYELEAIEYIRATLLGQREAEGATLSFTLGDTTPDGTQKVRSAAAGSSSQSERVVRSALDRVRPLAFVAAFKLQDMVAQWILRANGVTAWRFKQKLADYDRLQSTGSIVQPSIFAKGPLVARAFWELYRALVPFRNTVTHSGSLVLRPDGAIEITLKSGKVSLATEEQGSYMRAMSLLTKILIGHVPLDEFREALIEADLLKLEKYHKQKGLAVQQARRAALTVQVPTSHISHQEPLSVVLDFDHIRQTVERACGAGPSDHVFFSVKIIVPVASRDAVWDLPMDSVPSGQVTIQMGDFRFDPFLRMVPRNLLV